MSKELEAFEIICGEAVEMDLLFLDRNGENQEKWRNSETFNKSIEFEKKYGKSPTYILKQALQRLEAIDNANPSEALEDSLKRAFDYGVQSTLDSLLLRGYDTKTMLEKRCLGNTLEEDLDEAKTKITNLKAIKQALINAENRKLSGSQYHNIIIDEAQEQDFNYKNIVLPFFNELVELLGVNDTDEMLDKIKKEHKALEIIKEKLVDVFKLYNCKTIEEYNRAQYRDCMLTQEEFDSLKEVLGE